LKKDNFAKNKTRSKALLKLSVADLRSLLIP